MYRLNVTQLHFGIIIFVIVHIQNYIIPHVLACW